MLQSRKLICVILAAMLCLVFFGCGQEAGLTKVQLSEVTHSLFYAPQYVAIELGYFEEEGLEVELTNGGGADKVMTAVLSGQADIGLCGPEASIYVLNEGREDHAVVFAQMTKRDGSFIVSREDEEFSWDMLRGKSLIGGREGGMPLMTLEYTMRANGVEPGADVDVITNVAFDLMAGAFEGGQGDYVTLFEPTASLMEQQGKGYVIASVGLESGEVPYTAYAATKSYIEKNPEIIQGFTNAICKAQKWVQDKSAAEIAELIKGHFPDTDIELLTVATQAYMDADAWVETPVMKEEAYNRLQDIMTQAGELDTRVEFTTLTDNTFAEKAVETLK